jgi:hypothetical protein
MAAFVSCDVCGVFLLEDPDLIEVNHDRFLLLEIISRMQSTRLLLILQERHQLQKQGRMMRPMYLGVSVELRQSKTTDASSKEAAARTPSPSSGCRCKVQLMSRRALPTTTHDRLRLVVDTNHLEWATLTTYKPTRPRRARHCSRCRLSRARNQ